MSYVVSGRKKKRRRYFCGWTKEDKKSPQIYGVFVTKEDLHLAKVFDTQKEAKEHMGYAKGFGIPGMKDFKVHKVRKAPPKSEVLA